MKTLLASRDRVAAAASAGAADLQTDFADFTAAVATAGRKRDGVAAAPAAFAVTDDQTL